MEHNAPSEPALRAEPLHDLGPADVPGLPVVLLVHQNGMAVGEQVGPVELLLQRSQCPFSLAAEFSKALRSNSTLPPRCWRAALSDRPVLAGRRGCRPPTCPPGSNWI